MTKAVCFKCGEMKSGSFISCKSCHIRPLNEADMVLSLGLSDHYLTHNELNEVAQRIKKGEGAYFEQEQLEILAKEVKKFLLTPVGRMLLGQNPEVPKKRWWQFWG